MIIQFRVKNFLSFKEEVVLDMSAVYAYKEHMYNLIDYTEKEKLLKVATIYGANASGKSNFVLAMKYFQEIIRCSFNNSDENNKSIIFVNYCPFSLDDSLDNIEFEVVITDGKNEYKYGYEYNEKEIVSEWLYAKNNETNRTVTIFERANNITFGPSVRKECETYKDQISTDTLILSFFNKIKLKNNVFNVVYNLIMTTLVTDENICDTQSSIDYLLLDEIENNKEKLLEFLSAIDTGIKDIEYIKDEDKARVYTTHNDKDGKGHKIPYFYESRGTIKCVKIYLLARLAINNNGTMVVDELNAGLHPLLLKFIIDLFYELNSKSQLIYTTHDTTLLDRKFFRRDQIWFIQKDEFGQSDLVALAEYKVRSDASFEKDYLAGVYGGIPFLKDFEVKGDKNGK